MRKGLFDIRLLTRLLVLLTVLLPVKMLCAANVNDSIIEVPRFLISGWYKGVDKEPYDSSKWYRNTSLSFNLNPEMLWDKARYDHNLFNFGFSLIKEYNPSTAYSFGFNFANSDKEDYNFRRFGVEAGYHWNLTNFYFGMDRKRRYNVVLSTGLELGKNKHDVLTEDPENPENTETTRTSDLYYGGYLGLRFSRAFSPHTSLFVEPRFGFFSDSYDGGSNPEGFDVMATSHVGFNYKLSEMLYDVPPRKELRVLHDNNWFLELSGDMFLPVPRADYIKPDTSYTDNINYGGSVALGYRVNPLTSGRARFTFYEDRLLKDKHYLISLDLMVSGTNLFLGENLRRYTDMSVILGPLVNIAKVPGEGSSHMSWGAEAGLQFTRRITPSWEVFFEPRFQLVQDYSKDEKRDLSLKKRFDLSAGMVYLYEKREKQRFNEWQPFQNWYIQALAGAHVSSLTSGHQIGSFDYSLGRNFGPLYSIRASIFSGTLQSNEADYDETWNPMYVTYYGGRLEAVGNLLHMLSQDLNESRWNMNISGGVEYGRLTNHYNNQIALVGGAQLQYRVSSKTWITAGGRYQQPLKFDAKLPLYGHIGLQHDMKDPKRIDVLKNYWRWFAQGGVGFNNAFFNRDKLAYGGAVGLMMTPAQGARLEFIGSKSSKDSAGVSQNWMSISPEYVLNLSNRVLGEDPTRRFDFEVFTGLDFMVHSGDGVKVGFNLGTQMNAYINNSLAFYVEPRFSFQPFDKIIAPTGHDVVQYHTMIGLRYIHNRFYTVKDQSAYRDLFQNSDIEYRWAEKRQKIRNWRPFAKWHPIRYVKKWHPWQNLKTINQKQRYDSWRPLQKLYFQTTWDAQLAALTSGHQIGSFDFTIGRSMTPLWSVQASFFSGELQSDEPNYDDTDNPMFVSYYGGRAELVFNLLRLWSPEMKNKRWNWNVSAGGEMGHLSNKYKNSFAITAASQLQWRMSSHMWLTGGGRLEKLSKFNAKLPLSGLLGIQYDFKNERRIDILANKWRWYVQGGTGFHNSFFNMDLLTYNFGAGININPRHGARVEFMGSKKSVNAEGIGTNWMSLSPEYVFNMTNKILGEDDKRRVDMELFAGLDLMLHSGSGMKVGYNAGSQVNFNVLSWLAIYVQPRISFQPSDKIIAPTSHDKVQLHTNFGLRFQPNRFKSNKENRTSDNAAEDIEWR